MNRPDDRVAVPTNGHRPAMADHEADPDLAEATDLGGGRPSYAIPRTLPVPNVTPGQVAIGFGILAALIVLLLGRRRGGQR